MTSLASPTTEIENAGKHGSAPALQLWHRYHLTGDSDAESKLVEGYLPLVRTVIGRVAMTLPSHVEIDDLYSAGLIGLLNAVRNFDPRGGSTFETYARVRIRGAILDELRRLDWVPRSVHAKARKVQAVIQELEQSKGEMPTNVEIAAAMKITVSEYERLLDEIKPATFVCLDSSQSSDMESETSRYESIPDDSQRDPVESASNRELAAVVAERLDQLRERATELPLELVAGESAAVWQGVIDTLAEQRARLLGISSLRRGQPAAAQASAPVDVRSSTTAAVEHSVGKDVSITFDAARCIHSRHCVLDAPAVFRANTPGEWLHPDAMPAETVVAVAANCPSGAIRYERHDGGSNEAPPEVNQLRTRENGPYAVHASLLVDGVAD